MAAVLVLFACLGLGYSLAVPAFEKPDEVYHYAFARHLAQGNPLPVQTIQADGPWLHEGTQAPLYYFLVGRLIAAIDQSDFDRLNVQNPYANLGNPLFPGNKNFMLYSARPSPPQDTKLAVLVGRCFSWVLGCLTILLVYLTARLAFPGGSRLAWLSALLVASIPQFAFISTSVSNDSMITVMSAAVIYWLGRLVVRNKAEAIKWWEWGVLGILLGLAALSKLQGLVLFAPDGHCRPVVGLAAQIVASAVHLGVSRVTAGPGDCRLVVLAELYPVWRVAGRREAADHHRVANGSTDLARVCRRDARSSLFVLGFIWLVQYHPAWVDIRDFGRDHRLGPGRSRSRGSKELDDAQMGVARTAGEPYQAPSRALGSHFAWLHDLLVYLCHQQSRSAALPAAQCIRHLDGGGAALLGSAPAASVAAARVDDASDWADRLLGIHLNRCVPWRLPCTCAHPRAACRGASVASHF